MYPPRSTAATFVPFEFVAIENHLLTARLTSVNSVDSTAVQVTP